MHCEARLCHLAKTAFAEASNQTLRKDQTYSGVTYSLPDCSVLSSPVAPSIHPVSDVVSRDPCSEIEVHKYSGRRWVVPAEKMVVRLPDDE
eukprot:2790976-Heterocapsa_arctica.AAC.1